MNALNMLEATSTESLKPFGIADCATPANLLLHACCEVWTEMLEGTGLNNGIRALSVDARSHCPA